MGYYIQDDMWEALADQPLKVRREVLEAICLQFFEGEERELKGVSRSLFIAFRDRVKLSRTRSIAKRESDASKSETCGGCVGHKTGTKTDFAIKEGEGEREEDSNESSNTPKAPTALCSEVVDYLNAKAGTGFKATSSKTQALVRARSADGFTASDFRAVVDNKVADWGNDPKMAKYLRPETLFGTKFEGYLNERKAVSAGGLYSEYD